MNIQTQTFIEELKNRPDVLGVILFGSWANDCNRPDSDVDLIVIVNDGFRRAVEKKDGQIFEIIYTTEKGAIDYWESHRDDGAGLWEVAKVLFDKDGTVHRLQDKAKKLLELGKGPIVASQLEQLRFDADDQINFVENILTSDPLLANYIPTNKIFALTELFFDIRREWTPAPKQRLAKIKGISLELYSLLQRFYQTQSSLENKLDVAKKIVTVIFGQIN